MNDPGFEIYFCDLKPNVQQEILEAYNIADESEMNWDTFPLFTLFLSDLVDVEANE